MPVFPTGDRGVLQFAERGCLSPAAVLGLLVSVPGGSKAAKAQNYQELFKPVI